MQGSRPVGPTPSPLTPFLHLRTNQDIEVSDSITWDARVNMLQQAIAGESEGELRDKLARLLG